ncbi:MAG TPA: chaperone modulator CbpM [Edaphocola sp.]|nr:chaperone modulator CbpM [Edaphocola sp.]
MSQRISKTQCIAVYEIEENFFDALIESGLINVIQSEEEFYLEYDELDLLERFTYLHYDLEINVAGLEVIDRLLAQIKELQKHS